MLTQFLNLCPHHFT